jgi:hypothetical protein
MMDSLYAFKCKPFRNTRHTVTFGIALPSSFLNTLYNHKLYKLAWVDDMLTKKVQVSEGAIQWQEKRALQMLRTSAEATDRLLS